MWVLSAPQLPVLVTSCRGVVLLCQAAVLLPHQKCELWAKYSNVALNLVHIFAKLKAG